MNPRRAVVEDRALALAERLLEDGNLALGSRLRETVPETFGNCDEHVPMLRAALLAVEELPAFASESTKIINALNDLPGHLGRRGRVWIGCDLDGSYSSYWEEDDWLEQGPEDATREIVVGWAALRSDDVRFPHGQE